MLVLRTLLVKLNIFPVTSILGFIQFLTMPCVDQLYNDNNCALAWASQTKADPHWYLLVW